MPTRRRDLLIIGGAVAAAIALPPVLRHVSGRRFDFEPISGLPGFRRIDGQGVTLAVPVALLGIDRPTAEETRWVEVARRDPCRAVFGPGGWPEKGIVPVALFTDYNCPNCPEASALLRDLVRGGAAIAPVWHDYPILGPASERSARLAIAAGRQGAYDAAHRWLMHRALPPGPVGLRRMAEALALDAEQLAADAISGETAAILNRSRAAAAILGIAGTPSIVVGQTRVTGNLGAEAMQRLIALEAAETGTPCG